MIFSTEVITIISVSFFILLLLSIIIVKKRKKGHLDRSLDVKLFLIKLPKYENREKENSSRREEEIKAISMMEQFFANFLYLDKNENFFTKFFKGLPRIILEMASETGEGDISFYVAVPSSYKNAINKYIQGVYSGAVVEEVTSDYTIFEPKGEVSSSWLSLEKTYFFPVNTYEDLGRDPLEAVVNSIGKISPDEGSGIQVVVRPAPFSLRGKGERLLSRIINDNRGIENALSYAHAGPIKRVFKEFSDLLRKEDEKGGKESHVDEATIQMIREKVKKPGFEVNIRLFGVANKKERADEILQNIEGSFSQFMSGINGFKFVRAKGGKRLREMIYQFSFRNFNKKQSVILNSKELTSVFHFPLSHIESPYIKWVKTKEAPPPAELPREGVLHVGDAIYRGEKREVNVYSREDRRRHFYIIGQTGVGKSTLLREMIRQDIKNGEGVGVIDPHGELIEDTLKNIPRERIDDVVLFEPFDRERPCGLNMLEWDTPEQRDFAVSEMVTIFSHLFPVEIIGPMFEYYMRNAMLAIMADKDNPGTIAEIPRIFTDDKYMEERLSKVSDHIVRNFWLKEWKQTTGQTRSDMLGYVVSKIGRFITDETMRNIVGQQKSGFDLDEVMSGKKIFLANLSKGLMGEVNSSLLGLILVSKMQIAALRRARIPEEERKDFYLYVDEFQNFTTNSVATILSEARKYKLNLIIAHQYMPQLKEEIRDAVIGNVGTMMSMRVGATDAEFLEKQFEPEFSKFDLSNLDNFQYITKMIINNRVTSPFKIAAPKPTPGSEEMAEVARKASKTKYGRPREAVEAEILERSKLGL